MNRSLRSISATLLLLGGALQSFAIVDDKADHPYQVILDRNPFGLRPPDPPPTNTPPPVTPPANLKLTGISRLLNQRRVYLMALPAPGKTKPEFYDFAEGEGKDGIEVLEINEDAGSVKIKNAGNASVLTFAANGLAPAPAPAAPGVPVPGAAPTAQVPPGGGASTVVKMPGTVAGAQGAPGAMAPSTVVSTVVNTGRGAPAAPNLGQPVQPNQQPYASATIPQADFSSGNRTIPSRALRVSPTPQSDGMAINLNGDQLQYNNTAPQNAGKQLSVEEQIVLIELQREANKGRNMPPLPPTPLSPQVGGDTTAPQVPGPGQMSPEMMRRYGLNPQQPPR